MREVDRIVKELQHAYNGDAWYGPSVRATLDGVDVRMALARPIPGAHTIAEIVLHMMAWTREITRRLNTGVALDPADGDWPVVEIPDESAWTAILEAFDAANEELTNTIASFEDAQLGERIGDARNRALGSGVSRHATLHGIVQHHAYHAGQITLLKKASTST